MSDAPRHQCGTCEWWRGPILDHHLRRCDWPVEDLLLPFWVRAGYHRLEPADCTQSTDGRRCETWAPRLEGTP